MSYQVLVTNSQKPHPQYLSNAAKQRPLPDSSRLDSPRPHTSRDGMTCSIECCRPVCDHISKRNLCGDVFLNKQYTQDFSCRSLRKGYCHPDSKIKEYRTQNSTPKRHRTAQSTAVHPRDKHRSQPFRKCTTTIALNMHHAI